MREVSRPPARLPGVGALCRGGPSERAAQTWDPADQWEQQSLAAGRTLRRTWLAPRRPGGSPGGLGWLCRGGENVVGSGSNSNRIPWLVSNLISSPDKVAQPLNPLNSREKLLGILRFIFWLRA